MTYQPRYDEKALLREEIKQLKAQNVNLSGEVQRLHRELQNVPKARLPSVLEKYGRLGGTGPVQCVDRSDRLFTEETRFFGYASSEAQLAT